MSICKDIEVSVGADNSLRLPDRVFETIEAVFAASTSPASASDTFSSADLDSRGFVRQLFDALTWQSSPEYGWCESLEEFPKSRASSRFEKLWDFLDDTVYGPSVSDVRQRSAINFVRLCLDSSAEGPHKEMGAWMHANSRLQVGRRSVREMLEREHRRAKSSLVAPPASHAFLTNCWTKTKFSR